MKLRRKKINLLNILQIIPYHVLVTFNKIFPKSELNCKTFSCNKKLHDNKICSRTKNLQSVLKITSKASVISVPLVNMSHSSPPG